MAVKPKKRGRPTKEAAAARAARVARSERAAQRAAGGGGAEGGFLPSKKGAPGLPPFRLVRVDELVPYANNARTHSAGQIAKIAASVKEFGFTNPVLVDAKRGIIAGHGRVLAAAKLGMETVPTLVLAHLSAAQKRAYVIADNKLALDAGWDEELLALELGELRDLGFDLGLTGFNGRELDALFGESKWHTGPDEAPPLQANTVASEGDVWLLGSHRLACGDSTSAAVVAACLGGAKPHLMVTDPPYGVNYVPNWRHGSERRTYMGDFPDTEHLWEEVWKLFAGDVVYVWHSANFASKVWACLESVGFEGRAQIIWNKDRFIIGRGHYCYNHEPCFYGVRRGATAHWQGAKSAKGSATVWTIETLKSPDGDPDLSLWSIKHLVSSTNHGAQKPVECMRRPIENSSAVGDLVFEPFSGSGTTIIAGEMTERCVLAIELMPAYVDLAIRRWQAFTGKVATLEATGQTFAEIEARRTPVAA